MKQRTEEWVQARLGHATASCAEFWMAQNRTGGVPVARKEYLTKLVLERLNGMPLPSYQSAAMLAGIELEPEARRAYAFEANVDVIECGFIRHPTIAMSGASPDGFVGDDGLVEIKCPTDHVHLDTLMRGTIPQKYYFQMQFQMAVTGRAWCDFVSYDPNYPQPMRLVFARIPRKPEVIRSLEVEVQKFLREVDDTLQTLRECFSMMEAA